LFRDIELECFGEFQGAKFKIFLYRELPQQRGAGRLCGKFWTFEIKDIIK